VSRNRSVSKSVSWGDLKGLSQRKNCIIFDINICLLSLMCYMSLSVSVGISHR
jgi:hypothetical protein